MQPISLKLENFGPYENSLIDFSSFYAQSLFLITGKTGAGKTTIFDGMCFALYGKTSGGLREGKEMRSNFAEIGQQTRVIFTFKQGDKTYEIIREPEQLVKKQRGDGFREKPAEVSLTIFDANQNEINQLTKQKEVGIFLGDLIQLNEQQFSQIVMLPQGEFRRFLNADSDSKEKVLRKLFNTYFYQDLAELLRQKKKSQENLLKDVKKELEVLVTQIKWQDDFKSELEEDMYYQDVLAFYEKQAESYAKELLEKELDLKKTHENQEKLQARIQEETKWLDSFEELAKKEEQKRNQDLIEESIQKDKKQMTLLQKIEKISPTYQQLKNAEHEHDESIQKEASLLEKQKEILNSLSMQQKNYELIFSKEAEVNLSLEKIKEMTASEPLFEKQKNLIEKEKEIKQQLSELNLKEIALHTESEELDSQISEWQSLISNQLSLNETKNTLEKEQQQKETHLLEIKNYLELKTSLSKKEQEITTSQNQLTDKQNNYEVSLSTFKQLKSDWAKAQIAKLSLDLVPGEACPVCGSTEHPAPSHGESMTKEELTQLEMAVEQNESIISNLRENIVSIEKTLEFFVSDSKKLQEQIVTAEKSIADYFNNEVDSSHWLEKIEKEQELVEAALAENKQQLTELEKTKIDLDEGLTKKEHLTEQLKSSAEQVKVAEHESIQLTTELKNLQENLPDMWTTLAEMLVEKNKLIIETTEWQKSFNQVKETIEDLTKEKLVTETTLKNLTEQQVNIVEKLNVAKKTIAEFTQNNQLDLEEIADLVEQLDKLPELATNIQNFEKEDYLLTKELARLTEILKDKIKPDIEPLLEEKQLLANEEVDKQKYIATLSYEIKENQTLIQTIQTKELAMKQDLDELEELAELTNVMTGDGPHKLSMERFVLQTYLKRILQRANEKLVVLTNGRYRFELKEEQASFKKKTGLEINIFDDNVGSLRSVNTLSGGESFIAALSLALSLAEVIQEESGGIQIDAMFIDEGFGSLDEDALEMAIRALENIEGDGRLIGIISHVRELKERIPQQLAVQSTLDGKSYVTERLEFE